MRGKGVLLVTALAGAAALGAVAFLAQRPAYGPALAPHAVARVSDVSPTPLAVKVLFRRGSDRILQRERTGLRPCSTGDMGCQSSVETVPVRVFLVQDEAGLLHAFIGEDPRSGCALEWRAEQVEQRQPAGFHDLCHGSHYDRRGRIAGGPSPWGLNELALEARGDMLWVDPRAILTGPCHACAPGR